LDYGRKAIDLLRELAARGQDVAVEFGAMLTDVATILRRQGDIQGAIIFAREGVSVRRKLAARDSENIDRGSDLATGLFVLGDFLQAAGDQASSVKAYDEGLAISRTLIESNRTKPELQRLLSVGLERLGNMYLASEKFTDALAAYRETLDIA